MPPPQPGNSREAYLELKFCFAEATRWGTIEKCCKWSPVFAWNPEGDLRGTARVTKGEYNNSLKTINFH